MQQYLERLKASQTPEQRIEGLGKTFTMVTGHMIDHMRLKGGNRMLPSRERENIDYVSIYAAGEGSSRRAIDLHSSRMWWVQEGETSEPLGMVGDVTPEIMLRIYAPLKDRKLMEHVGATVPEQLAVVLSGEKSEEEKKVAFLNHIDPAISAYIASHEEELMEALVRDMSAAFNKVLGIPQQ